MTPVARLTDAAMNALERLRNKMSHSINEQRICSSAWGQPYLMTKALAEVKKAFDAPTSELPERSITKVLEGYRRTGNLQSFLDLKYACFGVGQRLVDGWCLFDDDQLFSKCLYQVDELQTEPRRFRKCYQGLLSSYFSYPIFDNVKENWQHLGEYLIDSLPGAKQALPPAEWLMLLEEHKNLLGPKPCERYANELKNGSNDVTVHQMLREGLGVPRESWVWQELVLSQVEVACRHEDQSYKDDLARLLRLLQANTMLSVNLIIRCISMLVSRYAQCSSRPEHPALRDSAVSHIGNPWLKRTAWDAHVKTKDGQPYEAARQMVNGWIKRRLIKDFFELLSDDGSADQRRLNFWLRFEPAVEDMWFALGPYASKHLSPDFKDFRNRARGRMLTLEAPGLPQNNAFIMRLGSLTIVEFGSMGNAAYIYKSENLPFDLSKSWISGNGSGLKNKKVGQQFIHKGQWEVRLHEPLCQAIGFRPPKVGVVRRRENASLTTPAPRVQTPTPPPVANLSKREREIVEYIQSRSHLIVDDLRPKGGGLWVRLDNNTSEICKLLLTVGFKYKPGKGWWKE